MFHAVRVSVAVCAVFVLIACVIVSPSSATIGNGKVAFSYGENAFFDLYSVEPDGSNTTQLTDRDFLVSSQPVWSPNGTKIAFVTYRNGNSDINVSSADGSDIRRLTTGAEPDLGPSWSPDGSKIAFSSYRNGNVDIYVSSADGTGQAVRLTNDPGQDQTPTWSPNASDLKIAFTRQAGGNRDIYTVTSDGTSETQITNDQATDTDPGWSPDGSKIAYASTRSGSSDIYTVDASGANDTQVTSFPEDERFPAWSPDGTKIAYATSRQSASVLWPEVPWPPDAPGCPDSWLCQDAPVYEQGEVHVMDADGNNDETVVKMPSTEWSTSSVWGLVWSPDMEEILVTASVFDNIDLYLVDAERDPNMPYSMIWLSRSVTRDDQLDWFPSWSPDGTKIAFTSYRTGTGEIYILESYYGSFTESVMSKLTDHRGADSEPSWSPDGTKIAYSSDRGDDTNLYSLDTQTSSVTRLTEPITIGDRLDYEPSWSPDSTKLAFTRRLIGEERKIGQIYSVSVSDGTGLRQLTDLWLGAQDPDWSPDGAKIVFSAGAPDNRDHIYLMDTDGSNQTKIKEDGKEPAWSPDGSKIAFVRGRTIFTINADGSGETPFHAGTNPDWSPDGAKIVFTQHNSYSLPDAEIYSADADTGGNEVQLNSTSFGLYPSWQPVSATNETAGADARPPDPGLEEKINRKPSSTFGRTHTRPFER